MDLNNEFFFFFGGGGWGTAHDSRKLERLQERALRLVYKTTTESYDALLNRVNLKLTTLQNRRLQDVLFLMFFKVKNKLTTNQIADICYIKKENTNSKRYNLRNADFVLPRFKTVTYGRNSPRFLGPQLWSKLAGRREVLEHWQLLGQGYIRRM